MTPELTTREAVERLVQADSRISAAEIARQVGVTRQRVTAILDDLGYELVWRKRKRT